MHVSPNIYLHKVKGDAECLSSEYNDCNIFKSPEFSGSLQKLEKGKLESNNNVVTDIFFGKKSCEIFVIDRAFCVLLICLEIKCHVFCVMLEKQE